MLEFWCQTRSKKITKARWVWRGGQDSLEPSSVPAYYITWSFLCPTWMIIRHLSPKRYSGRFFFLGLTKAKHPNLSCFEGVARIHSCPRKAQGFLGRSVKINMKLGNAKTLSVSDHLCGRLTPKKSKADTELSPECVRSHLPNQWSFRSHKYKAFFFFFLSFSSFALQEERDGDKRNYSDWRLGCHRRSVLIAVAVTALLCTNN